MGATELLIIIAFFLVYLCVRFGLPLGICWLISQADHRFLHPQA